MLEPDVYFDPIYSLFLSSVDIVLMEAPYGYKGWHVNLRFEGTANTKVLIKAYVWSIWWTGGLPLCGVVHIFDIK